MVDKTLEFKKTKHWTEMSKEELKAEVKKCEKDPKYFIRNYMWIIHPIRGKVLFDLYPFQSKVIDSLHDPSKRFNITRKFRQAGISTIHAAYLVYCAIFMENKTLPVLSIGDTESVEFLDRAKIMYDELPPFLQPKCLKRNEHTLELSTGSKIISRPSKKTSGRSLSGYLLTIDEAAFIEHIDDIWKACYPIISTGGRVSLVSTVNGLGNFFANTWMNAVDGANEFNPIDLHWTEHPEYQYNEDYEWLYKEIKKKNPNYNVHKWRDITFRNVGLKAWLQEYEAEFLGTGDTYLDGETIKLLLETVDDKYETKYNNRSWVWEEPRPNHLYVIGVDTALGRGLDYSTYQVIDVYNGNVVCEFNSNKTPINEFAKIIAETGWYYNTALVVPERNTIGNNLIDRLINEIMYDNVHMDEKGQYGLQVTTKNREELLADMEELVRNHGIKIKSRRTSNQFTTFIINDTGKPEADEGQHDDLISALTMACHGLRLIRENSPIDFEHVEKEREDVLKVGYKNNIYTYKDPAGNLVSEDAKWLIS